MNNGSARAARGHNGYPRRMICTGFVFFASVLWGASFVTQKLAGQYMGSFTYNGVRFAMGALVLLPVIFFLERHDRQKNRLAWKAGLAGGLILFVASNLQQFGIILSPSPTSAGEAGFITGLYTVLVPIFGLALGRRAGVLTFVSAALAFGGLALISIGPEGAASIQLSDLLLVLGAVFWAVHILVIDHFADSVSPLRFASIQFAVASALSLLSAFSFEQVSFEAIRAGALPLLYGGVLATGLAYTLQIFGQRGVAPARAAIIFSLESLFAALSEAVFLGQAMTLRKYIGGAVIFAGILLSQLSREGKLKRRNRKI